MVRVVRDGKQLGIMATDAARRLAQDAGLDLVEVAPQARPPVCHIIDYAKYKYDQQIREKSSRKNQKQQKIKEVRLTPAIQTHDIATKVSTVRRFIAEGNKVKLTLQYRRRENAHKEEGFRVINEMLALLVSDCEVGRKPALEGNRLVCMVQPKGKESN
jgi:translation initiation factor IF-3